jgi:hypothetical protein
MSGVARNLTGVALIVLSAPAFLAVVSDYKGLGVVAAGVVALGVLAFGVCLAGRWLGVFERRHLGDVSQPGCLALLVTLLALLEAAVILYYVVLYGAGAVLGGWNV